MKAILLALILGSFAFANESEEVIHPNENLFNVAAGFGPTVLEGEVGMGFSIGAAMEAVPGTPFYMGLDLGYGIWNYEHGHRDPLRSFPSTAEGTAMSFQLLPTFYYKMFLPMLPAAIPFIGVSVGPNIYSTHVTDNATGTPVTLQTTSVYAEFLLRAGLQMVFSDRASLTIEPKMGFMGPSFIFNPTVSALWTI